MPFFLVCILVVSLFIFGCMKGGYSLTGDSKTVTSEEVSNHSRAEIEDMLKQLEKKDAPSNPLSAMCFALASLPVYVQYVCPIDGEKTLFGTVSEKDKEAYDAAYRISGIRRYIEDINSITDLAEFSLDESRLCHKCFPEIKNNERYVTLVTKYPDGKEVRYDKLVNEDLSILNAFLKKELYYGVSKFRLKHEIGKIREMLGINVPSQEENK